MPVFGTSAATFNDNGVTALYQHLAGLLEPRGLPLTDGRAAPGDRPGLDRRGRGHPARPGGLPGRDRRARSAATTSRPKSRSRRCGGCRGSPTSGLSSRVISNGRCASGTRHDSRPRRPTATATATRHSGRPPLRLRHSRRARRAGRRGAPRPGHRRRRRGQRRADRGLARRRRVLLRRRAGRQDPRPGAAHHADPRVAVRQQDPPGGAAALRRPRRAAALPARGEPARATSRSPPGCSRSSARARTRPGCSPARATRSAPTGGSSCCRRAAGHPAVDRVRLGHPVRPRPGGAPRHLRQGRHLRRVDRDAGRHEGALRRVRPGLARPPRCR